MPGGGFSPLSPPVGVAGGAAGGFFSARFPLGVSRVCFSFSLFCSFGLFSGLVFWSLLGRACPLAAALCFRFRSCLLFPLRFFRCRFLRLGLGRGRRFLSRWRCAWRLFLGRAGSGLGPGRGAAGGWPGALGSPLPLLCCLCWCCLCAPRGRSGRRGFAGAGRCASLRCPGCVGPVPVRLSGGRLAAVASLAGLRPRFFYAQSPRPEFWSPAFCWRIFIFEICGRCQTARRCFARNTCHPFTPSPLHPAIF